MKIEPDFLVEENIYLLELYRDGKINRSELQQKKKEISQLWEEWKATQ